MPAGSSATWPSVYELLGVEPGEVVERPVQQRHVGPAVAQQPRLLADLAQEHVDGDRVGFGGVRVEQRRQQFAGRTGLRGEHQRPGWPVPRARRAGPPPGGGDRIEGRPALAQQHRAGVGQVTPRRSRSSSSTPSRRSSWRIARDSGGWAIPSRTAARPKCSSSATATKYRSSRVSRSRHGSLRLDTRRGIAAPPDRSWRSPRRGRSRSMACERHEDLRWSPARTRESATRSPRASARSA